MDSGFGPVIPHGEPSGVPAKHTLAALTATMRSARKARLKTTLLLRPKQVETVRTGNVVERFVFKLPGSGLQVVQKVVLPVDKERVPVGGSHIHLVYDKNVALLQVILH